jgi:broad specificity phosphatase PhoE
MSQTLPPVYLDVPLTARGEQIARLLGERLTGLQVTHVFTSPLQRARRTCELAGFGTRAVVDPELVEWDYGDYEGKRSAEIRQARPDWSVFRDGCPGGESPEQVGARADRVIARIRQLDGDVILFSHGHFLRVLAARWLGLPLPAGRFFLLGTGAICILGYDHDRIDEPAIRLWNDDSPTLAAAEKTAGRAGPTL